MRRAAKTRHPLEVLADSLAAKWAAHAVFLREHQDVGAAVAYERAAQDLKAGIGQYLDEALDTHAIAEESGYHPVHVARLIDAGTLPEANAGGRKVRRRDLPRKPGHGIAPPVRTAPVLTSRSEIVRRIAKGQDIKPAAEP